MINPAVLKKAKEIHNPDPVDDHESDYDWTEDDDLEWDLILEEQERGPNIGLIVVIAIVVLLLVL